LEYNGIFEIAIVVHLEVLWAFKGIATTLVVDVRADRQLYVLGQRIAQSDIVVALNCAIAIARIVDFNVDDNEAV
jgi:hypothetical protein